MTYSIDTRQAFTGDKRPPLQSLSDIKAVEISFEEHEISAGEKAIALVEPLPLVEKRCRLRLIAKIIYDDSDFVTQPWMVIINGLEIHRASTWAICYNYITWHMRQGTLPDQQEEIARIDCDTPERSGCRHRIALPVFVSKQSRKSRQGFSWGWFGFWCGTARHNCGWKLGIWAIEL